MFKPAGLNIISAYFLMLTVAAQPAWIFGMQRTAEAPLVSSGFRQAFYAISLESPSDGPKVVLASSGSANLAVSQAAASGKISMVGGNNSSLALKVVTLDFGGVKLSVGSYQARAMAVKVLPMAALNRYELGRQKPLDTETSNIPVAPAVFRSFQGTHSGRVNNIANSILSSGVVSENPLRADLILRC